MGTQGNTPYFTRKCRAKIRRTPDKSFRKNAKEMDDQDDGQGLWLVSSAKTRKFILTDRHKASRLEQKNNVDSEEKNCHSKLDENQKMFDLVTHILMLIFDKEEQ